MNRPDMKLESAGPRHRPLRALARTLAGGLGLLGLSACVAPVQREPMRVAPHYRVEHAGPGLAQGYAALARRYEGEGRWAEALQAWHKAVLAEPGDADLQNALGKVQARHGDGDAAVATFQRAAALAPGQAALLNNLGYALMLAGRNEEARQSLQQALALQPGHARAQANLERLDAPGTGATVGAAQVSDRSLVEPERAKPETANPESAKPETAQPGSAKPDSINPEATMVEIANGNGVNGMAACMAESLRARGALGSARLRNALPYDTPTTVVRYRPGHAEAAQTLAGQLPGRVQAVAGTGRADSLDLRIVLGHDLRAGELCVRRG